MLRVIGNTMPPARALFDGTIEASTVSVATRYASREIVSEQPMNRKAMRRPARSS